MQRGYAICTTDLARILTIAPCKTKFIFVTITTGKSLTNALCFKDLTLAKTVEKRARKNVNNMCQKYWWHKHLPNTSFSCILKESKGFVL